MKTFFSKYWPVCTFLTLLYFLIEKNGLTILFTCLQPVLSATICIYLLEPIVNFFSDMLHLPRLLSLLLTYLSFLLFIALLLFLLLPDLLHALSDLLISLPSLYQRFSQNAYLEAIFSKLPTLLAALFDLLSSLSSLLSSLGSILIGLIMAFYFLLTHHSLGEAMASSLYSLLPSNITDRLLLCARLLDQSFRSFITSKLLLGLIQGCAIFSSTLLANLLFHLSIPSPLFMGLITFFTNLVPLVGPILGILFCSFFSFLYGIPEMLVTCCLLLLWQQIDNLFLSPHLIGNASGLSPFWVLASVAAATSLGSFWLILMAVPLTAFAQSFLRAWREKFAGCSLPPSWLRYRP